jgi:hypothetical protein
MVNPIIYPTIPTPKLKKNSVSKNFFPVTFQECDIVTLM